VPPVVGPGSKRLTNEVGENGDRAAGTAMYGRGVQCGPHGHRLGGIHDGIMDQHHIELPGQAQRSHVTEDMLAFRVQPLADGQHARRPVSQGQSEMMLQMKGETAAAGAQLQQGPIPGVRYRPKARQQVGGFVLVLGGWGQEWPPGGEFVIQTGHQRSSIRESGGTNNGTHGDQQDHECHNAEDGAHRMQVTPATQKDIGLG
jgi:hypothetical protein